MSRPIVMKFSRGDDYQTTIVISDYDSITYHATQIPEHATPDIISKFFLEAERAATKQFEALYDTSNWEEQQPLYHGG